MVEMGTQMQNGINHVGDKVGPRKLINRVEYVRLIQQALHKLGFASVAQQLESESGIQMQPPHATDFQCKILSGDWDGALRVLPLLSANEEVLKNAKFLVLQQKYLEALEAQNYQLALNCLRGEMAPLKVHEQQLHHLAGLLLCPASSDLDTRARWLGGGEAHRSYLLSQLQSKLPPSLMIPEGRLEQLIEQALTSQVARCQYHNAIETHLSLFSDYQAGAELLPTQTVQVLELHTDEIWHIHFSHRGLMLASASKDRTAVIWQVKANWHLMPIHTLPHNAPVAFLSWSPDDTLLLTCSEEVLRLWDVASGQILHAFSQHTEVVTSCCWMPDNRRFLSGSVDKTIYMFDVTGAELQKWKRGYRVQDMVVSHNGTCVIIACSDRQMHILRLQDQREVSIQEVAPITSIALSPDSRYVLVNLQSHTVHLWHLGPLTDPYPQTLDLMPDPMDQVPNSPQMQYKVNDGKQGRFVLRSNFGGTEASFVVHGSEDCQVYLWHRDTGDLLQHLEGHAGTVNSVSWNPANPYMLASASDDKTIRIWLAAAAVNQTLHHNHPTNHVAANHNSVAAHALTT